MIGGEAAGLLAASLLAWRELGNRRGIAISLAGLTAVAVQQRQFVRAAQLLGAAQSVQESVGAALEFTDRASLDGCLARAQAALGRDGFARAWDSGHAMSLDAAVGFAQTPPPRAARLAAHTTGPISSREREVAALIAQGLTNREIGQRLLITEGTATNHVTHIMNKLTLHARAQIATWAVQHGLLQEPTM